MEIAKKTEGATLTFVVSGCLDTTTSPDLQAEIDGLQDGVGELVIDFTNLDYISSAGLRVMLVANKKMMASGGEMKIVGTKPPVREVFDMTGFSDILNLA